MNSLHKKIVYILQKNFYHYVQINDEELSKLDNDEANYLIKRSKVCTKRTGLFCKKLLDIPNSDIKEISSGLLISFKLLCEDLHEELSKSIEILDTFD